MDFIKQNKWSVICLAVAVLAVIFSFYPLGGMQSALEEGMGASAARAGRINTLLTKTRLLPVPPGAAGEAERLTMFPTAAVVDAGDAAQKRTSQEAADIAKAALEVNSRATLTLGALPRPRDEQRFDFRRAYLHEMMQRLPYDLLKAVRPIDQQAMADRLAAERAALAASGLRGQELQTAEQRLQTQLPRIMAQERAMDPAYRMYVDGLARQALGGGVVGADTMNATEFAAGTSPLAVNPIFMPDKALPDPYFIWQEQVALWIRQDVCRTIALLNDKAKNVMEAPVKRLLLLQIPSTFIGQRVSGTAAAGGGFGGGGGGDMGGGQGAAAAKLDFKISPTGRTANPEFDVLHFTLVVHVRVAEVPVFLRELSRGRFLTVIGLDMNSVDAAQMATLGMYYGNDPVVELRLRCEALFLRSWTVPLMPNRVRDEIVGSATQQRGFDE